MGKDEEQAIETTFKRAQMLGIAKTKEAIIIVFKEVKEAMLKEVKRKTVDNSSKLNLELPKSHSCLSSQENKWGI